MNADTKNRLVGVLLLLGGVVAGSVALLLLFLVFLVWVFFRNLQPEPVAETDGGTAGGDPPTLESRVRRLMLVLVLGFLLVGAYELVLFHLVTGWVFFLLRTLPHVAVGWSALLTGLLCLVLLTGGLHLFLRRYRRDWVFRWTFCLVAAIVLSFVAGLSGYGLLEQVKGLRTS